MLPAAVVVTPDGLTVTDGTVAGTSVIKPNAAADQFYARDEMASLGNSALFVAGSDPTTDVTFGTQLWQTDGTAGGTSVVLTLPNNATYSADTGWSGDAGIFDLTSVGSRAVFIYSDGSSFDPGSYELWSSDGTAAGTFRLPVDASYIDGAATVGGQTLLATSQGLVSTDGTVAGTSVLKTLVPNGYQIIDLVQVAGGAAFVASQVEGGQFDQQLWWTDGTGAGTHLVRDFPDPSTDIADLTPFGDKLLFTVGLSTGEGTVWSTDGTPAGTTALPSLQYPSDTTSPVVAGGHVYTYSSSGLSVSDGTEAGTTSLASREQGVLPTPFMAPLGDKLLFTAQEPTGLFYDGGGEKLIPQLYLTDGTPGGTTLVTALPDNTPQSASSEQAGVSQITSLGNRVLFDYNDGTGTVSTWVTDGTSAGTYQLLSADPAALGKGDFAILGDLACFAAGTRLATERGEVAVENLRAGDSVLSARGVLVPVIWAGHREVDCRRHPEPEKIMPVRVAAHAFGAGQPARDLWLSPDHAVFIENVLIPIRHLVNGVTVQQVEVDAITYYHIETERHELVLAEGLATETYLETGNRAAFANGDRVAQIHPDFGRRSDHHYLMWETFGCAPLRVAGEEVERARLTLSRQAETLRRDSADVADAADGTRRAA